jgi:threonylcarbamoyladenosine tRNA methylthiotransferase MtaB
MKFKIVTLGCKVNTYESNVMRDLLINNNYIEDEDADIFIINTCTVTNTSDNKSLKEIRRVRREYPNSIIIVCGCMTQVRSDIDAIDADIIIGNRNKTKIIELLDRYNKEKKKIIAIEDIMVQPFEKMQLNNFNRTRAFVKIEDGCENFCSYCIIPYARGKVRSKQPSDVIEEVNTLVSNGHKEIVLTGIHTGHYGADLEDYTFAKLLSELVKIDGLERIRISSIEMNELNEEVLDVIKNNPKIVSHLHIPIQSGSDEILKLMNRKYLKKEFMDKIDEIRAIRPDINITTDIIVGFPGETEELFEETLDTVSKIRFSKIHVFPFSLRKGTKAEELPNHIDDVTKKRRVKKLMEVSNDLEIEYMDKYIGKDIIFIPEVYRDGYLIGHTGNYLLIKYKGNEDLLHQDVTVKGVKVEYPYLICE